MQLLLVGKLAVSEICRCWRAHPPAMSSTLPMATQYLGGSWGIGCTGADDRGIRRETYAEEDKQEHVQNR